MIYQTNKAMKRWNHPFVARTRSGHLVQGTTGDLIQRYLYMFGLWEPNATSLLSRLLSPGDVFVDVGANIGYFTLLGSRLVGNGGRVIAIEASPAALEVLQVNLQRNKCTNVRVVHEAAFSDERELTLSFPHAGNIGAASTAIRKGDPGRAITVAARPISSMLTEEEARSVRVIKMDIEGGEVDALLGLLPLLDRLTNRLDMIVEVSPEMLLKAGHSAEQLLSLMAEHGFEAWTLQNSYEPETYAGGTALPSPYRGEPLLGDVDFVFTRPSREHQ